MAINIYKALWARIGGRKWTWIIRDVWHEAEWVMQTIWFGLGVLACWLGISFNLPLWTLAILWAVYTFGYLNGHLFWGKKWIKGQGKQRKKWRELDTR